MKYRFQWTFPVVASRHDRDVVFVTSQHVHRSRDRGMSWATISPDLTRADPRTLEPSGGPLHKDNVSTEYYATIFAFAESPRAAGVLWAGSDDGLVHLSRDDGLSWQDVTPPTLPEWALISTIEPSPHATSTAYLAATRYKTDDFEPYLFRTTDFGASWTRITTGLPHDDFTRVIRADPDRPELLYAGTETGAYVSFDDGEQWQRLDAGLPVTPVHDLAVKDGDLVVATHGRSFWILDDVTPLHQWTPALANQPAHLFQPRTTRRFRPYQGFSLPPAEGKNSRLIGPLHITYARAKGGEVLLDAGANPPNGVLITYWHGGATSVELSILDADGATITTIEGPPQATGLQRVVWDMRYPAPLPMEGATFWDEGGVAGPLAPPGQYRVQLATADAVETQPFEIQSDPRVDVSREALTEQFTFLMEVRDRLSDTHAAANRIAALRRQITAWRGRADAAPLFGDLDHLDAALAAIDQVLIERSAGLSYAHPIRLNAKLAALAVMAGSADAAPTRQARQVFAELSAHLDRQIVALQALIDGDLALVNDTLRAFETPMIAVG